MFRIHKQQVVLKLIIVIVFFAFASAGFSASVNSARIIPNGKVSIIKNGKVVGEFSKEVPLPKGALLKCEAQCTVKLTDAYIVAEPGTTFSVSPMANSNELLVQEGTVYFSVTESSPPLQFNTPGGIVTTRETSLTGSELKGYVRVSGNETQIGIIDGGTMVVETASGEMAIAPGKQVTIAMVNSNPSTAAAEEEGGSTLVTDIALGVVGAAVLVAGGYALYKIDWESSSSGSPSSP
jgi:hypothetical protein